MSLFRLPNFLFEYKLSSAETAVAAAMYSVHSAAGTGSTHIVKIKQQTICELTGIKCLKTVSKALNVLAAIGVIKWKKRSKKANTDKLGAYKYGLTAVKGTYTLVDRKIFRRGLKAAEIKMYLFICKCIDRHKQLCWNSYNDIAEKLSMSRSRVIELIRLLKNKGLIITKRVKNKAGGDIDNHYMLADLNKKVKIKKRKPTVFTPPLTFKNTKNILVYYSKLANYICQEKNKKFFYVFLNFFTTRGSPKKYISTDRNPLTSNKGKK